MISILLGISLTINILIGIVIIFICMYSRKIKKSREEIVKGMNFFGKENVEDEEAYQDFFNN